MRFQETSIEMCRRRSLLFAKESFFVMADPPLILNKEEIKIYLNSFESCSNVKDNEKSSYWITTNLNSNNNGISAAILDSPTTPEAPQNPPDYRTFLRNIRPPIRPQLSCSDDDSNDDEEDDENNDDVTINDRLELDQKPGEELASNDPELALSQLGSLRGSHAILKINITEQKIIKCYRVNIFENVWTIKQRIIQSLSNFRYKRRVFHVVIRNRKDSRKLVKMQNVTKQRELMACVQQRNCDKLHSLIKKGVDPNFHEEDGQETPLTAISTMMMMTSPPLPGDAQSLMTSEKQRRRSFLRSSSLRKSWSRSMANLNSQHPPPLTPVILALVGAGGAHLDFRNKQGFTPLHVAARSGNTSALKSLLELGASPDVVDMKGLTPLYHCCSMNVADDECVSVLLRHKAGIDCVDSQKWNVLHQICRYGHLDHLCVFLQRIKSSEDQQRGEDRLLLDSQNATGNTPLHVCALYNQEFCLLTLLDHGADPGVRNFANQDPFQVAIVAGNANLAKLIKEYPDMQNRDHEVLRHRPTSSVDDVMTSSAADTTSNRRHTFTPATFVKNERKAKDVTDVAARTEREAKRPRHEPKIMKPTNSKLQRYDTDLPPNATLPRSSILYQSKKSSPKKQTPPSDSSLMYIVLEDYDPDDEDHLALRVGDRVSVSSSASSSSSDLYCLGSIGDRSGLVPLRCLQPVQLRRPFNHPAASAVEITPFSKIQQQEEEPVEETNKNNNSRSKEMRPLPKKEEKNANHRPVVMGPASPQHTEDCGAPSAVHKYKNVVINKGADGYGFVLRGTKANGEELQGKFQPNSRNPGLQYLESVDPHGAAYVGGLRAGDVILKVNGTDVRFMGHSQIVEFIRKCGRTLHIHVASAITQNASGNSSATSSPATTKRPVSCLIPPPPALTSSPTKRSDVTQSNGGGGQQQRHMRTGSVVSAISKLDNVIALESGNLSDSDEVDSATLRRRPGSRQIRPSELQDIFLRQTASKQHGEPPQQYNSNKSTTTLSRQLIKVTTPTLPNKETPSPHRTPSTSSVFSNETSPATQSPSTSSSRHSSRPSSQLFQDELLATIKRGPKKKLPPPPPKRTDSKLSTSSAPSGDNKDEVEKPSGAQIAASVEESIRNRISSSSSREPPPVKPKLKATELKKARAVSISSIDNEVKEPCSPLELALKAKKKSLNRKSSECDDKPVVSNSLVKPSEIKMQKPPRLNKPNNHNATKKSETFDLPPPPPAPVPDLQNELFNHPRFGASVDLPPPPDEVILNSPDVFSAMPSSVELPPPPPLTYPKNSDGDISSLLPPATSFVDGHQSSGKMDTTSGSVIETSSNTDSGIEPNQHHQTNMIETGSIISTISNVSSEDGSDFGVSMAFDKSEVGGSAKQAYLELIKKHNQHTLPVGSKLAAAAHQPAAVTTSQSSEPASSGGGGGGGKALSSWSVQDVGDWLRGLGLDVYVPAFAENEIAGSHLPDLGKEELMELGVKRIGHRLTIEKSLKNLR